MFKRKAKTNPNVTDTLIGEGTVIKGPLKSKASIRIEGKTTGDIVCEGDVTIGVNGYAKSDISARNVIIAGTVKGNVTSKGKLTIHCSGKLYGNLSCGSLNIVKGGVVLGSSKMQAKETEKEKNREPTLTGSVESESAKLLQTMKIMRQNV